MKPMERLSSFFRELSVVAINLAPSGSQLYYKWVTVADRGLMEGKDNPRANLGGNPFRAQTPLLKKSLYNMG